MNIDDIYHLAQRHYEYSSVDMGLLLVDVDIITDLISALDLLDLV